MKKRTIQSTIAALASALLLMTVLGGCGKKTDTGKTVEPTATPAPAATAAPTETPAPTATAAPTETPAAELAPARQDGERFETTIVIEGTEETVRYEHIRNSAIGVEMDYDYEKFQRRSDAGRECFVSVYDLPNAPENYLELTYRAEDADTVAAEFRAALSQQYELLESTRTLEHAGSCLRIEASVIKGTNNMADQLQTVYIIPASDGCRVATEHCAIEASEGFGRRFSYMLNTLAVIEKAEGKTLSADQALAAVQNYCYTANPDLKAAGYPVYWEIVSSSDSEIVVMFRSYTGAINHYYIDPATGETYVTELVPGIINEEQRTGESFNVLDYASAPEAAAERPYAITGTWQTASMSYASDGSMAPEYYVQFTDTDIVYGHMQNGSFVADHADPIVSITETNAGFRVQAEASNGVRYSYQTSRSDQTVLEYYETWDENEFAQAYRGGASLSRIY